jgi:hypothetical protein
LKVGDAGADSSFCSTSARQIGASVKTKASIVAMSGAIMPEPLAMPLIVTAIPQPRDRASRISERCRWS